MSGRVAIAGFGGGVVVGFLAAATALPRRPFTLDDKVNAVQLAALATSIVVSVAFYRRFEKQKYSDKLKKDGLLARLKVTNERVAVLEARCETRSMSYLDAVGDLAKCRRTFSECVRFANAVDQPILEADHQRFFDIARTLDRLLTDTPRDNETHENAPLRIVNGNLVISARRLAEVQDQLDRLRRAIGTVESAVILNL